MIFFTVGVMGHASQIALGLALVQPARPAYCFDGDGVALIHTESMEIIGQSSAKNLIYMVFNNGIHGCVSVQPTVGFNIDITQIAVACCYATAQCVATVDDLKNAIIAVLMTDGVSFIEVQVRAGKRADIGRQHHHHHKIKLR